MCCGASELMTAPTKAGARCAQCGDALPDTALSWIHETADGVWHFFCTPSCYADWQVSREKVGPAAD